MAGAWGVNGSWGKDTANDPRRNVSRIGHTYGKASNLHYEQGIRAEEVLGMDDDRWKSIVGDDDLDRGQVAQIMRAYEHYQ